MLLLKISLRGEKRQMNLKVQDGFDIKHRMALPAIAI